tara:strand:+ start:1211 stop:1393 length:183 start_codon:yes stop_codon:yes gene_type:complete
MQTGINEKLTLVQSDYKQHLVNKQVIKERALSRLTELRKEMQALNREEEKVELIISELTD